jgi:hypothetical protein
VWHPPVTHIAVPLWWHGSLHPSANQNAPANRSSTDGECLAASADGGFVQHPTQPGVRNVLRVTESVALTVSVKAHFMKTLCKKLLSNEDGFILSAEIVGNGSKWRRGAVEFGGAGLGTPSLQGNSRG